MFAAGPTSTRKVFAPLVELSENIIVTCASYAGRPPEEIYQELAEDYVRMSVAKMKVSEPGTPVDEETTKDILVVGGGVAGLNAADIPSML